MMEFHISREVRDRYQFSRSLFSFQGNVVFAGVAASREFAHRMNRRRAGEPDAPPPVQPGALYAMGLIDEISHALVEYYRRHADPRVMAEALDWMAERVGQAALERTLIAFVEEFPAVEVYQGEKTALEWLGGSTEGVPHREAAFEELMLLWLANANPAFAAFAELFSDAKLSAAGAYREIVAELRPFFANRPRLGRQKLNLVDMLRAPAVVSPDSLSGQMAFIREHWAEILGPSLERLLLAMDVLKEEDLALWMRFHPPAPDSWGRHGWEARGHRSEAPSFAGAGGESESFSPDQDWMPSTVLLAKSTYVWLEQLSREYGWHIHRLDQIPHEELARMARRGINALWLIGVWERSRASQTIKQLCGNHDAVASAYSLDDYAIAADLGGDHAYRGLRDRAMEHGIRLASDMVPNHMGIDSRWVIEHPEWFLSRSDSPYPAYRFEGPDLSHDGRVEIKIDDGYYAQSDAAVVFRRRDRWTGEARYIYHGNDGTSFPWNDTAQIDYLNPAAREQVIRTILHVARLFPIIRFDAAMTLAKRHIQRLWFPAPGSGGAIPSRAECGMTKEEFDRVMPQEFWREVVDRVAREVPGTLLLAEAFWLMEGYFVRTLGMHRVYNSAFMNMMRDEENAKYRSVIKNTIEFDPDILKRYVNFMSNPDEHTAIDQFGTGDKYFGVATVMATLPGLPMFAHGQIEGFSEKYGMEFRRARQEERPDAGLVERHEREIAPLLLRRRLFAESANFLLYDFYRQDGSVDENVFAYSNRRGEERILVLYHNRYAETEGTIHQSAAYVDKAVGSLRRQSLAAGLGLPEDEGLILAFRDLATGLQHLERGARISSQGLSLELQAYRRHVFVDWRELRPDEDHPWDRLADELGGRGVASVDEALLHLRLAPAHASLLALLAPEKRVGRVGEVDRGVGEEEIDEDQSTNLSSVFTAISRNNIHKYFEDDLKRNLKDPAERFFTEAAAIEGKLIRRPPAVPSGSAPPWTAFSRLAQAAARVPGLDAAFAAPWPEDALAVLPCAPTESQSGASSVSRTEAAWVPVLAWCAVRALGAALDEAHEPAASLALFDGLRLRDPIALACARRGAGAEDGWRAAARVRLALLAQIPPALGEDDRPAAGILRRIWNDPDARWLMGVHDAAGGVYFNRELHRQMVWWLLFPRLVEIAAAPDAARDAAGIESGLRRAFAEAERAGYRLDRLPNTVAGALPEERNGGSGPGA